MTTKDSQDVDLSALGGRVRKAREKKGWTRREVGRRLVGIHESTISRIESGRRTPTLTQIVRLARLLGGNLDAWCGLRGRGLDKTTRSG